MTHMTNTITYNTQMEPITVTNVDGHTWRFEYDWDGEVIKETDYNGLVTETRRSRDGLRADIINGEGIQERVYSICRILSRGFTRNFR